MIERGERPMPDEFEGAYGGNAVDLPPMPAAGNGWEDEEVNRALREVCRFARVDPKELLVARRGRTGNPARAAALCWLVRGLGMRVGDAAWRLGMREGAARQMLSQMKLGGSTHRAAKVIFDNLLKEHKK